MLTLCLLWLCFIDIILGATPNTLIVVKDDFSKYTYSRFFKSLKRRGHKVSIKSADDKSIKLTEYGESLYNNLILLSPSSKQIGDLAFKDILTFIDNGNNLFVGVDNDYSTDFTKKIADRCGIEIHSKSSNVYDHVSYDVLRTDINAAAADSDTLRNNVVLLSNWPKYEAIISSKKETPSAPVLYSGIGMSLKANAHLTLSLLSGNVHTYSALNGDEPVDKAIVKSGNALSLIAALQMRNNARITFVGSLKMLSDEYFISPVQSSVDGKQFAKSGNEEFMALISAWSFGERGILRLSQTTHHLQKEHYQDITVNPTRYRIKDLVTYSAKIEEYRLSCDCYVPFKGKDVQFEFIRLDAFIRQFMQHDEKGNFKIDFMLPDVFGVYKFTVNYQRKGWGYVFNEQLVSVRPFRHDEYQRFLPVAYPYYLGSASMIVGFIVFTFVFLFGEQKGKKKVW